MKARITKHVVSLCALLVTGVVLNGCNPELVPIEADTNVKFGAIRIMNFAECDGPIDLYIYKPDSKDTVIFRGVAYGVGGAYATNLPLGTYELLLTRTNSRRQLRPQEKFEITSGQQKTFILWEDGRNYDLSSNDDRIITTLNRSRAYVRFLNTKQSIGNVQVAIDNPLNDPTFSNVAPRTLTDYVELRHAMDTSYAIYLTRPDGVGGGRHEIVSRLAGATFAPGGFYTIVFGGNDDDCRDTSAARQDTLRIRYFDDNEVGNELTFPAPRSLRFNVVNNLINPEVLKEGQRRYDEVGVVINNEDRYLISRMKAHDVGPVLNDIANPDPNVISTGFYTVPWTDAVQISMYKVDGVTGQQRGTQLVNTIGTTMPNDPIQSDEPFSIVIMDTVSNTLVNGFPDIDANNLLVPLPTVAHPDSITLVLVNGLVAFRITGQPRSTSTQSKFTVNGITPSYWNTPQASKQYSIYTIHKDALIGGNVVVVADIGRTTPVHTLSKTFKAQPGGVYEVVLVGERENTTEQGKPKLLILHTNPKRDNLR